MWEVKKRRLEELRREIRTLEKRLRSMDPKKTCGCGVLELHGDEPKINLKYLGKEISISLPKVSIVRKDGKRVEKQLRVLILKYLLGGESLKEIEDGVDLSEAGVDYSSFAKKIGRLFYMRGNDFIRSLEGLGGKLIPGRETKLELEILPKLIFLITFEEGDEDRAPSLKVECGRGCLSVLGPREISYILRNIYSEIVKEAKALYSE